MSERHRLARRTLIERFERELLKEAVADPRRIALNVALLVERLHGFEAAREVRDTR